MTDLLGGMTPPFERSEYKERVDRLIARLAESDLDALIVTAGEDIEYLTGFDCSQVLYFAAYPLIISPENGLTWIVREYDHDTIEAGAYVDQLRCFVQAAEGPGVLAETLTELNLSRANIGYEPDRGDLAPGDFHAWSRALPDVTWHDQSSLVARLMAVKTPAELVAMRQSMTGTLAAIDAFQAGVADRLSEIEIAERMAQAVTAAGADVGAPQTVISGPRTALPHAPKSNRRVSDGDVVITEVGGWKHGYAAGLCRTAIVGENAEAADLFEVARDALFSGIEAIKPGVPLWKADRAVRDVVGVRRTPAYFRHRAGYANGIGWTRRGYPSLEPGADELFEPGMTFHMPIILFEKNQFSVAVSESVLVTSSGVELLSGAEPHLFTIE